MTKVETLASFSVGEAEKYNIRLEKCSSWMDISLLVFVDNAEVARIRSTGTTVIPIGKEEKHTLVIKFALVGDMGSEAGVVALLDDRHIFSNF